MEKHPPCVIVTSACSYEPPDCPVYLGKKRVGTLRPVVFVSEQAAVALLGVEKGPDVFRAQQASSIGCVYWESDEPIPAWDEIAMPAIQASTGSLSIGCAALHTADELG